VINIGQLQEFPDRNAGSVKTAISME